MSLDRRLLRCLLVAALCSNNVQTIDLAQEIGYCKRLKLKPDSSLIYANEGVWFPQYRTQSSDNKDFTCHTLYEELSRPNEDQLLSLKQTSYFTWKGKVDENPKVTVLDQTDEKGIYSIDEYLQGYGMITKYHIMLSVTPDIRLRYVCTNSTKRVRKDFDLIYIETRRSIGSLNDILSGVARLKKTGLKATLVKINQNNCTRPISHLGYDESLFFSES